jgi:macrolide phosphotransferase
LHGVPIEKAMEVGLTVHKLEEARQSMRERMDTVRKNIVVGDSLWERWRTWIQNDEMGRRKRVSFMAT